MKQTKRAALALIASAALIVGSAVGASAWTNSADITCTSSTGWQVHIKTYSWGDTYHELVTPEGARYGWRYANGLAYKTRTTKTAKQMATSVTVIADDLASASRYCGTI
ncbi:hypothetical protein [Cellulomonas gilvus]|uniref:hypothetical protein n=1 Tax=Cellulomonas gilvus TaxID=11 RepID=UPI00123725E3|nr:hypothetical protein [Cellulomonas gilvus]